MNRMEGVDLKNSSMGVHSGKLKRGLGFVDLWSIGVGALIGGGIFTVIGPAVAQAGPALFVAFIIAGLVAIMSTMSYAELASVWPYQGDRFATPYPKYAFAIISPHLGRLIALWCAGLYFLSFAFAAGAVNLGFAGYFHFLFPSLPPVVVAPIVSILITGILLVGIKTTGKINTFFSIIQVFSLLVIAVIAISANPSGAFSISGVFAERLVRGFCSHSAYRFWANASGGGAYFRGRGKKP